MEDHLVERARQGDRAAFDQLVRRHARIVRRAVLRYTRNPADADDVVQIAFTRAFERIGEFRGESSFGTWLYRIAVNMALNALRDAPPADDPASELDGSILPLRTANLVAAEVWRRVVARLDDLPAKQKLAFELRVFEELTFKEIASFAECSEKSAKANYHHAVKRLRGWLPSES